jgi:signal transduction histidine kinase
MRGGRPPAWALDAALALVLTVLYVPGATDDQGELAQPAALIIPLALAQTVPLALRRIRPAAVLVTTLTAGIALNVGFAGSPILPVGVVVSLYTVAARCDRRAAVRAGLLTAATLPLALLAAADLQVDAVVLPLGLTAGAWMLGDYLRTRRAYLAELEAKAVRLEAEREEEGRRAVAREQARIARELHDVISHNVSVMVVQAAAGVDVFEAQPARARSALASIEATGREALAELRRLLGVIRTEDDGDGTTAPQPRLEQLGALVEQVRSAGLDVDLAVDGPSRPLAPGLDLAVYRVVQEALTNTLKHAGASKARVTIRYRASELAVEVVDDGSGRPTGVVTGSGHGLVGMRERVALVGGAMHAGRGPGGGFAVSARFPLDAEEPR